MALFEFITPDNLTIKHVSNPQILVQIMFNPVDGEDYDAWNDVYQHFQFRGNYIIALWLDADEYEEPEDYSAIHAILRKAFKHYKAHNFIADFTKPVGPTETDTFLLKPKADGKGWLCTNKKELFVIIWQHQQFNKTQKIEFLEDFKPEQLANIPRYLTQMTDWLAQNHSDKI